jgi:hypothetical protein
MPTKKAKKPKFSRYAVTVETHFLGLGMMQDPMEETETTIVDLANEQYEELQEILEYLEEHDVIVGSRVKKVSGIAKRSKPLKGLIYIAGEFAQWLEGDEARTIMIGAWNTGTPTGKRKSSTKTTKNVKPLRRSF